VRAHYLCVVSSDLVTSIVSKSHVSHITRYDFKTLPLWKTKRRVFKYLEARIEIKHLNTILTKSSLPSDHEERGDINSKLGRTLLNLRVCFVELRNEQASVINLVAAA